MLQTNNTGVRSQCNFKTGPATQLPEDEPGNCQRPAEVLQGMGHVQRWKCGKQSLPVPLSSIFAKHLAQTGLRTLFALTKYYAPSLNYMTIALLLLLPERPLPNPQYP